MSLFAYLDSAAASASFRHVVKVGEICFAEVADDVALVNMGPKSWAVVIADDLIGICTTRKKALAVVARRKGGTL